MREKMILQKKKIKKLEVLSEMVLNVGETY
jgi:hypothetical protein